MESLPRLFNRRRLPMLALLIGNGLGQAAAAIGMALLVQRAFDRLLAGVAPLTPVDIVWLGGGMALAALVAGWLRARERVESERLGQDYVHNVRMRLHRQLVSVSPRAMQSRSHGATTLRFVGDLSALRLWISRGIARLIVAGVTITGVLAALIVIAWPIAVALTGVIVVSGLLMLRLGRNVETASRASRRRRARLSANVTQQVAAIGVIHAFGQADREHDRLRRQSKRLRTATVDRARATGNLMGLGEGAAAMATAVTLAVGALEVGAERISAGTVVAAMAIVGLLMAPLRDLGRVEAYRQDARVAFEKIGRFLESPGTLAEAPGATPLEAGPGRISFNEVELEGSLAGIDVSAGAGSLVVIVGPNGAGKTTLLALAARLIEPTSGAIHLDGQDLAGATIASIREAIGVAGPDFPLIRGTIGHNLRYRYPGATDEEIDRVWRLCGIPEVLGELPDGEETRLADDGANLSAGQRQRIALARAILGGPRLLLLDEADANLDPDASTVVDRVLAAFPGTVLLVTHRRERLANAAAIWHLRDGRLVEAGAAGDVLNVAGPTTRLFGLGPAAVTSVRPPAA